MTRAATFPRLAHYLTGLGLLVAVLGLGLDVWLHARDDSSFAAEELFAFSNPGHVVFGGGLIVALAGVVVGLLFDPSNGSIKTNLRDGALAAVLVVAASSVAAFGFTTSTAGHTHVASVSGVASAVDLEALDLSQEERFLVEASRHEEEDEGHGHLQLSAAEVARLADESARASGAAERYRSIELALADGYMQITQDLPLIGAHFIKPSLADGVFDPDYPEMLVYTFQEGKWRLYGLSYLSRMVGFEGEEAPAGFAGPYDLWHWHKDWCFTLTGAKAVDPDECRRLRGAFVERTGYMVHFWVVDNPQGVFAHSHPGLVGSDEYIIPRLLPR